MSYNNSSNNNEPVGVTSTYFNGSEIWEENPWIKSKSYQESNYSNYTKYSSSVKRLINQQQDELTKFYFSEENIDYIQDRLIEEVKKIKKVSIGRQSDDELIMIMYSFYNRSLESKINSENNDILTYIGLLNKSVIEECLKQILSGIDMFMYYYKDASELPQELDLPVHTSMKGSRILSEPVGIYDDAHENNRSINIFNEKNNIL